MSYEAEGELIHIGEVENKSGTFRSRDFVIKTAGEYPQFVKFQIVQDKVETLDKFSIGQPVKVWFDLRGREWQGKYFTNLNAWRVESQ